MVALLFKQMQKDNDLSGLLFEQFEARRKLMRNEHLAFNQFCKKSQVYLKVTNRSQSVWPAIKRFCFLNS